MRVHDPAAVAERERKMQEKWDAERAAERDALALLREGIASMDEFARRARAIVESCDNPLG